MATVIYTNGRRLFPTYLPFVCSFLNEIVPEYLLYVRKLIDTYFSGNTVEKACPAKAGLEYARGTKQV